MRKCETTIFSGTKQVIYKKIKSLTVKQSRRSWKAMGEGDKRREFESRRERIGDRDWRFWRIHLRPKFESVFQSNSFSCSFILQLCKTTSSGEMEKHKGKVQNFKVTEPFSLYPPYATTCKRWNILTFLLSINDLYNG